MPDVRHLRSRQATTDPSLGAPRPDTAGVAFTVSPTAQTMRRQLGPVAWAALEDVLCEVTIEEDGRSTARTSVRRIAAGLGVSKDTAARALARLVDAGLLVRHEGARADDGTFTPGYYEVLADRLEGVAIETEATRRRPRSAPRVASRRPDGQGTHRQPALFDVDEATR